MKLGNVLVVFNYKFVMQSGLCGILYCKCSTKMLIFLLEGNDMKKDNKTYSMSIRVTEEELEKLKIAARLESYSSYSEFIRRTALLEADEIIKKSEKTIGGGRL